MRAVIISSNEYIDKRIERNLKNNNIKVETTNQISQNMLNVCDCVIFTYRNKIPNLPKVLERIALEKKVLVIYINNTPGIGQFHSLLGDLHFSVINEMSMDFDLPSTIHNSVKYLRKIHVLEEQLTQSEEQLQILILTNKAKRVLMSKGLSEEKSHKFIQRKAMELRISKKKLVNLIIENKIDI